MILFSDKKEEKKRVKRFLSILKAGHVNAELYVWPDMMHMFQMADEYLAEAHLAIEKLGKHIKERTWN